MNTDDKEGKKIIGTIKDRFSGFCYPKDSLWKGDDCGLNIIHEMFIRCLISPQEAMWMLYSQCYQTPVAGFEEEFGNKYDNNDLWRSEQILYRKVITRDGLELLEKMEMNMEQFRSLGKYVMEAINNGKIKLSIGDGSPSHDILEDYSINDLINISGFNKNQVKKFEI